MNVSHCKEHSLLSFSTSMRETGEHAPAAATPVVCEPQISFDQIRSFYPHLIPVSARFSTDTPAIAPISCLHIAACALGTRGDVQPVALVAWHLAQQINSTFPPAFKHDSCRVHVTLITHAAHKFWIDQLHLPFVDAATGRQLQVQYVSMLPAAVWHAGNSAQAAAHHQDSTKNIQV